MKTKHDQSFTINFFFSCVKSTKLKMLLQAHLLSVEEPAYRFHPSNARTLYCSYVLPDSTEYVAAVSHMSIAQ